MHVDGTSLSVPLPPLNTPRRQTRFSLSLRGYQLYFSMATGPNLSSPSLLSSLSVSEEGCRSWRRGGGENVKHAVHFTQTWLLGHVVTNNGSYGGRPLTESSHLLAALLANVRILPRGSCGEALLEGLFGFLGRRGALNGAKTIPAKLATMSKLECTRCVARAGLVPQTIRSTPRSEHPPPVWPSLVEVFPGSDQGP